MKASIVLLPGDGIGPEVTQAARVVLEAVAERFGHRLEFAGHAIGGDAMERHGTPLPQSTLQACLESDAVLLGAVGGPRWDGIEQRPEHGLLQLRREMGVFANLRPVQVPPALQHYSPLRPELARGVDLLIVRELTGGVYFGQPRGRTPERAFDTMLYTSAEVARVARVAFELARGRRHRVTSVDKANVLESSRLWREVVTRVAADYPDVELNHLLVDAAAMELVRRPARFDVLLTENLFGDILSDQAGALAGSLGMLPSASLGASGPGLFEPVHGSAPDIAGQGVANPVGAMLSAAMLCRHGLGLEREANAIEAAVLNTLAEGAHTADLPGTGVVGTREISARVLARLAR